MEYSISQCAQTCYHFLMYLFSVGILFVLTAFLLLYAGSMLFHMFSTIFRKRAPFVPAPRVMIDHLPNLVDLDKNSTVYDLGCGDGRVLHSLHRHFPAARYIGIENDIFPFLLARLLNWRIASSRFAIKRKNFFNEDLSSATHIAMYLFPEVMDQLLPKLTKELRAGAVLVSFDFPFTDKKPERIITAPELGRHQLFVYRF